MARFVVSDDLFDVFPDACFGVAVARVAPVDDLARLCVEALGAKVVKRLWVDSSTRHADIGL